MKKQLISAVLITILMTGCSGNGTVSNSTNIDSPGGQASSTEQPSNQNEAQDRIEVKTDFKPVQPNSVPQLSSKQKSQVDSKISTTLDDIDKTLKSLQDAPEIDLSSIDK